MELLGVELHGHVEAHLRELQRHKRALPAFFQLLARALRGDLLQVLVDAIQGAKLPEQVRRDLVAMTSSASKPSALIAGMFMASRISSRWSSCDLSSSGMAERCALYWGKISSLNSGIPPSHTTPRPTSSSVSSSLSSMLVKP